MQLRVRWLALGHLDRGNTEAPNVGLVVVPALLYCLGCHPVRRPDEPAEREPRVSERPRSKRARSLGTDVFFLVIVAVSWPETPKSASLTATVPVLVGTGVERVCRRPHHRRSR